MIRFGETTVDLGTTSPAERDEALRTLLRQHVGAISLGQENVVLLPICSGTDIPVGATEGISVGAQTPLVPRRLIILEVVTERSWQETTAREERALVRDGWRFWRKRSVLTLSEHKCELRSAREIVPRGIWSVHGLNVGQWTQFYHHMGAFGGDLFGLDGNLEFDGSVADPGLTVHLRVSHRGKTALPFYGILVCKSISCETRCRIEGKLCDRPELHLEESECPRCGGVVPHDAYVKAPFLGAAAHSLPVTHPRAHKGPCGLPCERSVEGAYWTGSGKPPAVHSELGCPRCNTRETQ